MDIGTAKLCQEDTKIPHHLLDIVPITHPYAAGEFRKDALKAIEVVNNTRSIIHSNRVVVVYFNAWKNSNYCGRHWFLP